MQSYKGFDGLLWPGNSPLSDLVGALAPVDRLSSVMAYASEQRTRSSCEVIHCATGDCITEPVPGGFRELGIDVGYLGDVYNCYSAIFHELLFGKYQELCLEFSKALNEHCLFDDMSSAATFAARRDVLAMDGYDLEAGDGPAQTVKVSVLVRP